MAKKKIEELEGIGDTYGAKFREAGIADTDALLDQAKTKKGRVALAEKTGISEKLVLRFANMADLNRIKGVGGEFAELLESAGVDTVKELATRNAENLAAKMAEVNAEKKLTRRVPTADNCTDWINQAKELPPVIEH